MARPLRIEFPNAVYHIMARGNARQAIFPKDEDYERLRDGLARTVERCDWTLLAFACLPNHLHLFLQTPQARVSAETFRQLRCGSQARDVAAWLARRLTTATLRELAAAFGLSHPDSVSNLVRRVDRQLVASRELRRTIEALEETLTKTGNRV